MVILFYFIGYLVLLIKPHGTSLNLALHNGKLFIVIDLCQCRIYLFIRFWRTCKLEQDWFKGMSYLPSPSILVHVQALARLIHGNVVFTFSLNFGARASLNKIDSRECRIYLLIKFWCTCTLEQDWFKGMSYLASP